MLKNYLQFYDKSIIILNVGRSSVKAQKNRKLFDNKIRLRVNNRCIMAERCHTYSKPSNNRKKAWFSMLKTGSNRAKTKELLP